MSQITSEIQNRIISRLKYATKLKYGELQIRDIPNDLFNYHLQFLVSKNFLEKSGSSYNLSQKGIKYVADIQNETSGLDKILFKVNPVLILVKKVKGKIFVLNQLRKSHPSFGKKGIPGGVLRKGESMESAAQRKLKQETGLDAEFKIVGMARRFLYSDNELFSDVFFPVMYANKFSGELKPETDFGENMWVSIDEAIKNESAKFDSIVSLPKILRAIKKGQISKLPIIYNEDTQVGNLR